MERILIFANRHSGAFNRVARRAPLAQFAREAGLEVEIIRTQSPADLQRLPRERVVGKERKVAIAGGDGTLHAAVQALAETDVVLGILPPSGGPTSAPRTILRPRCACPWICLRPSAPSPRARSGG